MVFADIMPLWGWMVLQLIGLGLMVFGIVTLVLALRENKKKAIPSDATTRNGKNQSDTEKGIAENTLIIEEKREDVKP